MAETGSVKEDFFKNFFSFYDYQTNGGAVAAVKLPPATKTSFPPPPTIALRQSDVTRIRVSSRAKLLVFVSRKVICTTERRLTVRNSRTVVKKIMK